MRGLLHHSPSHHTLIEEKGTGRTPWLRSGILHYLGDVTSLFDSTYPFSFCMW